MKLSHIIETLPKHKNIARFHKELINKFNSKGDIEIATQIVESIELQIRASINPSFSFPTIEQ